MLSRKGLSKYIPIIEEQEVDIEAFVTLSGADLEELGGNSPSFGLILMCIARY